MDTTVFKNVKALGKEGEERLFTMASGPVIVRDGRVLLVRHGNDDFWKFPGGTVHDGESLRETAVREALEEACVKIDLLKGPVVLSFDRQKEGVTTNVVLLHYLAKITFGEPKPGNGVRELAWHSLGALPDDVGENIKPVIAEMQKRGWIE